MVKCRWRSGRGNRGDTNLAGRTLRIKDVDVNSVHSRTHRGNLHMCCALLLMAVMIWGLGCIFLPVRYSQAWSDSAALSRSEPETEAEPGSWGLQ